MRIQDRTGADARAQIRANRAREVAAIRRLTEVLAPSEVARIGRALNFDDLAEVLREALKKDGFGHEEGGSLYLDKGAGSVDFEARVEINPVVHALLRHIKEAV